MDPKDLAQFMSGGTARPVSHKVCVLYEPDSGRIRHIHQVVTLQGGTESPESDIEQSTRKHLVRRDGEAELHALLLDAAGLNLARKHRVDTKRKHLVPIDD